MIRHCLFIVFCIPLLVCSQVKFTHYTNDNGLPHDFTYQIYQDDDGYIWVGTDDGLAKFNGQDFEVFDRSDGFRSNFIIDIKKYNGDTLAIATWKGGLHLMKKNTVIIPEIKDDSKEKIHTIYILGNDILSFNSAEYYSYKKESGIVFEKNGLTIVIDSLENVFLQKTDSIAYRSSYAIPKVVNDSLYFYRGVYSKTQKTYLKGIYKHISEEKIELAFPFFKDKEINDFGKYDADTFYVTIRDHLYVFNQDSIIRKEDLHFNNNVIHRFAETSYCKVFIVRDETQDNIYDDASGNDHIYVYDKKKETFQDILDLANSKILVSDIFVDKDENIWITSKADGLYQLSQDKSIFSEIIFDQEHIIDMAVSNEEVVFFLTLNKIYGYEPKTKMRSMYFLEDVDAVSFQKDLITNRKLPLNSNGKLKNKNTIFLEHEIEEGWSSSIENANISYSQCCLYYRNSEKNSQSRINLRNHKENAIINDIEIVKDQLWVGTTNGVMIYDMDSLAYVRTFGSKENIQEIIYHPDQEGIWLYSSDGLIWINKENISTYYKEKDGLGSDKINDIFLDHRGILWIATQKGFSIFKNETFYNFNKKGGLPSSFVSKILEDKNHQIWVAGNKGVVRIDNTEPFRSIIPPNLIVRKGINQFSVDVIDYSGKQITTEYRTNSKEDWKPFENKVLGIKNYAIGEYTVQFRSRNPNSNWIYSEEYPFSIQQVWYKKLWFILSLSLMSTLLISSLIYLQLGRVSKRNKLLQDTIAQSLRLEQELSTVRENVAQDFHDELGNKLAGITVMSELMMKDEELKQTKSIAMISQVRKDAKDLYFGIKDFVWSIDAKSDDLKELMIYLSDFGEELFQNKGIVFKVEKHLSEEDIKLPYYWSRQLLLLFKEAMTNSLKHAKATEVVLGFYVRENILKINFTDNGLGFNISKLKRKNGLINMEKRAMKIGGEIMMDTIKGTSILFRGKFK